MPFLIQLTPASFSFVMATGILSIGASLLSFPMISMSFFWVSLLAYFFQWALTLRQFFAGPKDFMENLAKPATAPGYLTQVAATNVLGVEVIRYFDATAVAWSLWLFGIALWICLFYGICFSQTTRPDKQDMLNAVSGSWLLTVVSTQSIAILGSFLADGQSDLSVLLMGVHLGGVFLYFPVILLVLYRLIFSNASDNLNPNFWISMGAAAISSLVAIALAEMLAKTGLGLGQMVVPIFKIVSLAFLSVATGWIPYLLILGYHRHFIKGCRFEYETGYWSMVFPLGMYAVACIKVGESMGIESLSRIAFVPFLFGAIVWILNGWALSQAITRQSKYPKREAVSQPSV